MNARTAAAEATPRLRAAGIPDAAFEAELLARAAGGFSRARYFAGAELSSLEQGRMTELVARRRAREPLAYITGHREFYGLDFEVDRRVLIPRPEAELLVDIAVEAAVRPDTVIVEVGTGSGAVSIAVAHTSTVRVAASDISAAALAVAARNGARLGARVEFVRGHLAAPFRNADVVVANLPYIPSGEIDALDPEVSRWEPRLALDGGGDGLSLIYELVFDCARRLKPGLLALEVGLGQAQRVVALGQALGVPTATIRDLAGIERVVCLRWA